MPALPTSLILVGLVFAWLIVLVPMVSRRREHVPENDEAGVGYRVLEKSERKVAARPVLSRTAVRASAMAAPEADFDDDYGAGYDSEYGTSYDDEPGYVTAEDDVDETADVDEAAESGEAEHDYAERDYGDRDSEDPREIGVDYAGARVSSGRDVDPHEDAGKSSGLASNNMASGGAASDDAATTDDKSSSDRQDAGRPSRRYGLDDEQYRPVPVRGGRGGYDPQAAQQISSYRFQQRRRVALFLAALTAIGCVLGGLFDLNAGWFVGGGAGVILVLYFAYLRRQVRIEEDIRARRGARLARSQQLRDGRYSAAAAGDGYGVQQAARQTAQSAANVPPRYHYTGVPVDFDDSDPAFDDLDYYDPMPYRRVAGM